MRSFDDMTDEMMEDELENIFHLQALLTIKSQVPPRHRAKHQEYQARITSIEREQDERRQAHPTIAQQDTLHLVW